MPVNRLSDLFIFVVAAILVIGCERRQPSENKADVVVADSPATNNPPAHRRTLRSSTDCIQKKLSNQFDVVIHLLRYTDSMDPYYDSCALRAIIQDKQTRVVLDTIALISGELFSFNYENCDSAISFTTGYRAEVETSDNYYGDLVVADFNFDGRDDLALVGTIGGNGGPLYCYYLQDRDRKFSLDPFLTDSVSYFPTVIDKRRRRLTTYVHASAYSMGEHVYQLGRANGGWRQIRHRFVEY